MVRSKTVVGVVMVLLLGTAGAALAQGGRRTHPHRAPAANAALQWSGVLLEAIRNGRLGPPIVARAMAITHTCMFDAWAAYDKDALGTVLGGDLRRPARERRAEYKETAISYAAYRALLNLFPAQQARLDAEMEALGLDPLDSSLDPATPAGVGNAACAAVLAYRESDGANQSGQMSQGGVPYSDYTGYLPVNSANAINDPNRWQPLTFSNGTAPAFMTPQWGLVTPFALQPGGHLRPASPPLYPDPRYKAEADAILQLQVGLGDREKTIAEYWADGPTSELPPGHWLLFAHHVSHRDRHTLDDDVQLFFMLGNAMLDASIAVWECKRYYDFARPITAIRFLYAGQQVRGWAGPGLGIQWIDGANWIPYQPSTFITPPFAEYVSGHSTFSAAAAEVLARFTGSDSFGYGVTIAAGSSRLEPGVVPAQPVRLFWPTFSAAADEAGLSRRLGGIHFESGDLEGRRMGRAVGAQVWERGRRYIEGEKAKPAEAIDD